MPQLAGSPKDIEKRVLKDHGGFKSLAYYKKLLEELKSLVPTFFEELNKEKENAKGSERHNIIGKISRHKDFYCMILARAWGELKVTSLPEEEVLIEAYLTEFRKHKTSTPSALASVLEQNFNHMKTQETHGVKSNKYSDVCVRYEAYRAFLKETLGDAEFYKLEDLYKAVQTEHSKHIPGSERPAAPDDNGPGPGSFYEEASWSTSHYN